MRNKTFSTVIDTVRKTGKTEIKRGPLIISSIWKHEGLKAYDYAEVFCLEAQSSFFSDLPAAMDFTATGSALEIPSLENTERQTLQQMSEQIETLTEEIRALREEQAERDKAADEYMEEFKEEMENLERQICEAEKVVVDNQDKIKAIAKRKPRKMNSKLKKLMEEFDIE